MQSNQHRSNGAAWARWMYGIGGWLLVGAIVVQVFVVGMNVLLRPAYWGVHVALGHAIGGLILLQLALALLGRLPARVGWATALMLLLMGVQYNARALASLVGVPALAALHAVNALLLFWLAVSLGRWTWRARAPNALALAPPRRRAGGLLMTTSTSNAPSVTTLATFDAQTGEHPENVAVAADGTIYVTLHRAARLWRLRPNGETERFALPAPAPAEADVRFNGLVITPAQRVYVAVRAADDALAGIWELHDDTRLVRRAALPANAGLNGMAGDDATLYVADDTAGLLWRVAMRTAQASVWLSDPRLAPEGASSYGFPRYGANGLKLRDGALYVSNSSTGRVWRTAIGRDGTPGALEAFHPHVAFHNIDDFAFDQQGAFYFTTVVDNTVEAVRNDGAVEVVLTQQHGLDMPTAVAVHPDDPTTLLITNAAFFAPAGTTAHASLMQLVRPRNA